MHTNGGVAVYDEELQRLQAVFASKSHAQL